VIILRLLPGSLANGVTDIPKLPYLDKAAIKKLSGEKRNHYASLAVDRQRKLASTFRELMTTGQSYHTSNRYRESFYEEVVKLADEVNLPSFPVFVRMTVFTSTWKAAN